MVKWHQNNTHTHTQEIVEIDGSHCYGGSFGAVVTIPLQILCSIYCVFLLYMSGWNCWMLTNHWLLIVDTVVESHIYPSE